MPETVPVASVWSSINWDCIQAVILAVTAGIIWWYTKETQKLRQTAQQQVAAAHQQTQEIQRQIEVQLRPFLVVTARWHGRQPGLLIVQNVGNGAAINILISRGESYLRIPFVPQGGRIEVPVTTPTGDLRVTYVLEDPLHGNYRFPVEELDEVQFEQGVHLSIFYNNVEYDNTGLSTEQHQYRTNIRLRPSGVELLSSWKIPLTPAEPSPRYT